MKLKRMRDFWISSDANPKWTFKSLIPCLLQKQSFENNQYEIVHRNLVEYHHLKLLKFCCWHMSTKNRDLIRIELGEYLLHDLLIFLTHFEWLMRDVKNCKIAEVIRAKLNLSLHCKLNLGGTAVDFSSSVFYSRFDRFPFNQDHQWNRWYYDPIIYRPYSRLWHIIYATWKAFPWSYKAWVQERKL